MHACFHVCLCTTCVPSALGIQKRTLNPWDCRVGAGNCTPLQGHVILATEPSIFLALNCLKLPSPLTSISFVPHSLSVEGRAGVLASLSRTVDGFKPLLSLVQSFLSILALRVRGLGEERVPQIWSEQMCLGGEDTGPWMSVLSFAQGSGVVRSERN